MPKKIAALKQFWVAEKPIFQNGLWQRGSVIKLHGSRGKIFDTRKEAEAHGLELVREWVDRQQKNPAS